MNGSNLLDFSPHPPNPPHIYMSQVDQLREWRTSAIQNAQYKTAEFLAEKLLELTKSATDRFWLAKINMYRRNFSKAWTLVKDHWNEDPQLKLLAVQSLYELESYDDALEILDTHSLGDSDAEDLNSPVKRPKRKHPGSKTTTVRTPNPGSDMSDRVSHPSLTMFWRGHIYAAKSNYDHATMFYQDACRIDVRNYDAFCEIMDNQLLSPEAQKSFYESLDFSVCGDLADMMAALYKTKLSPYLDPEYVKDAQLLLAEQYSLQDDPDIKLAEIRRLLIQTKYKQAQTLCEAILEKDPHNLNIMPYYVACLYHEQANNILFKLAHELVDAHPDSAIAWLAVGTYYYSMQNNAEARRFFSKASIQQSSLAPAWIGFGHTFAAEKEHEQAISAYATAARLFPGSHMPNMFLGIQYTMLNNMTLAYEYLNASYGICDSDPLLLNELGVVAIQQADLQRAERFLRSAIDLVDAMDASQEPNWICLRANLGHVYRLAGQYQPALDCFYHVLRSYSADSQLYTALGYVYLMLERFNDAIESFHKALSLDPRDQIADEFLAIAMEDASNAIFLA